MNFLRMLSKLVVGVMFGLPIAVVAEDTDIFLANPNLATGRTNLLLVLDNAASNNSNVTLLDGVSTGNKLEMLRQVLNNMVDPLNSSYFPACTITLNADGKEVSRAPAECVTRAEVQELVEGVNIGLMIANPSGSGKGGYVRYHVRPMDVAANRTNLLAKINPSIPTANNAPYAKSMHEAYLYYGGKPNAYVGFDSDQYDVGAKSGDGYVSPITDGCGRNFILFIGNGGPDSGEENDTTKLLGGVGATAVQPSGILVSDPLAFTPSNFSSSWFDEYARTLFKRDIGPPIGTQNVVTYTIAVQNPADNNYNTAPVSSSRELLKSAANVGGGKYFEASNGQQAMKAFVDALRGMQPIDSVFASSTLPVSVNVRGEFLNQVYMGQFRPDEGAGPRWPGNLKQYLLAKDVNGNPVLSDSSTPDAQPVQDKVNGFLLDDITSFWTSASSYWQFGPLGNPPSASDAPDGSVVEKGGAAQRMRTAFAASQAARKLYTCNGSCSAGTDLSDTLFSTANTTLVAALGADLINWVRGADNKDNEDGNGISTDVRARLHGDLVHSRPAVVNYNRNGDDRDVMVFYGTNEGIFHAVKGGQDPSDGLEQWGMVFPEHLSQLNRLRENSPAISAVAPKPYFADGPTSVYQLDANSDGKFESVVGDKAYLYIGMRRGGRFAYALDVSNPTAPKHLWKIDNTQPDFSELGQTWSTLRPARIRASASDPVLIFGAGYDPENEDVLPAGVNNKGRGIFVVNARTGVLIKHIQPAGMGSVPADVTLVDRDSNGKSDRIYSVDTKGNLWRTDIDDANPANWQTFNLASLASTGVDARKLLYRPDVVLGDDFDTVLVGSGDREHPFDTTIENRFYMLKDDNTGLTGGLLCADPVTPPALEAKRACTEADLVNRTGSTDPLPLAARGWFVTLSEGEKVVSDSITEDGVTFFSTNRPLPASPGVCTSNLGGARIYAIGFDSGLAVYDFNLDGILDLFTDIPGGGFPPPPVRAQVPDLPPTICFGPFCIPPVPGSSSTERYRTHWYIEQ
ncbi:PilC/PilY family type IV pilus protein [Pseudomonas sp. SA3-5]|uniref:PilC/PilY family type IV pilus protein n=1 Tax=Pseudomonas aestuarii TaxID=3018340 RepID=A0ABT4X9R0_9PSED|nr:PilC/PilY family type IV pilus protein [Pseudomonas aestuarii]MDA7085121.1 PilC/PilY family type IV pilus protein [Pseudomonas aestuarii]